MLSTSSPPTAKRVYEAIITNSDSLVEAYLENGDYINGIVGYPTIPLYNEWMLGLNYQSSLLRLVETRSEKFLFDYRGNHITLCHAAIINLYHNFRNSPKEKALKILSILLKHGVGFNMTSSTFILVGIEGFLTHSFEGGTALDLAVYLKRFLHKHDPLATANTLDIAISMILKENKNFLQRIEEVSEEEESKPATSSILSFAVDTYRNLLFSETLSDITFQCSDGVSIPAHRNILSSASTYFQTAFRGSWAETAAGGNGIWETSNSSKVMKPILTLIYTGDIKQCDILCRPPSSSGNDDKSFDPLMLFEAVSEMDLRPMMPFVVENCIQSIGKDSISSILQAAHFHGNHELLKACFEYVQKNPIMLMQPDMIALASNTVDLWKSLKNFLSRTAVDGDGRCAKRKRTTI